MNIKRIRVFETDATDPHRNLAVEETLLSVVKDDELILYLWQNDHTIVIGKNQNPWLECKVADFLNDGGKIARRITGGGAVYHDGGNLNFSFIAAKENYDQAKQFAVICRAVQSFGIEAEVSGRNDVTTEGRKFSGNAFYDNGTAALHHGTILICGSAEKMKLYLTPDPAKLQKRSVASVASRVVNLGELAPEMTIDQMRKALILAAEEEYQVPVVRAETNALPADTFHEKWSRQASPEWIFGEDRKDSEAYRAILPEGLVSAQVAFDADVAVDAYVFTDALDVTFAEKMQKMLLGKSRSELEKMGFCPFARTQGIF
ncbi:MAG: lipoate--protein ligase [Lachnospiraceae bacterium]|nr:lipoate--protein ligase [Lachnospiraceae bacterium]